MSSIIEKTGFRKRHLFFDKDRAVTCLEVRRWLSCCFKATLQNDGIWRKTWGFLDGNCSKKMFSTQDSNQVPHTWWLNELSDRWWRSRWQGKVQGSVSNLQCHVSIRIKHRYIYPAKFNEQNEYSLVNRNGGSISKLCSRVYRKTQKKLSSKKQHTTHQTCKSSLRLWLARPSPSRLKVATLLRTLSKRSKTRRVCDRVIQFTSIVMGASSRLITTLKYYDEMNL